MGLPGSPTLPGSQASSSICESLPAGGWGGGLPAVGGLAEGSGWQREMEGPDPTFALRVVWREGLRAGVGESWGVEQSRLVSTPPSSPAMQKIPFLEVPSAPPSGEGMIQDATWPSLLPTLRKGGVPLAILSDDGNISPILQHITVGPCRAGTRQQVLPFILFPMDFFSASPSKPAERSNGLFLVHCPPSTPSPHTSMPSGEQDWFLSSPLGHKNLCPVPVHTHLLAARLSCFFKPHTPQGRSRFPQQASSSAFRRQKLLLTVTRSGLQKVSA